MPHRHVSSALPSRLEALRTRHSALSTKIEREQGRVSADDWYLKDLKRQKLHLKEEIEVLRSGT